MRIPIGSVVSEVAEQAIKRWAKSGLIPKGTAPQVVDTLAKNIDLSKGADIPDVEVMLKGMKGNNDEAFGAFTDYTRTSQVREHINRKEATLTRFSQNSNPYTRPDAIANLQAAGADRLTGRKTTPRTIQGPVPPQLADKTFNQGAQSYEEAVMLGTTKFTEDGVAKQIRNYGSDTAPHGRVTEVDVRKMSGRGTEGRLTWEKLLTIDKKAKGFYGVKLKGHEHAHHWNPIGVMKRVVEGLDTKTRNQLISEAQNEFGLYSGNTMFNLRQLPTKVHDKLHKALNKAGYDPKKMQSFAKADYATRKEFLRAFSKVLNDLDQQVFGEIMIEKHGPNWISKFQGLQIE